VHDGDGNDGDLKSFCECGIWWELRLCNASPTIRNPYDSEPVIAVDELKIHRTDIDMAAWPSGLKSRAVRIWTQSPSEEVPPNSSSEDR
jgi:hypothetical protein